MSDDKEKQKPDPRAFMGLLMLGGPPKDTANSIMTFAESLLKGSGFTNSQLLDVLGCMAISATASCLINMRPEDRLICMSNFLKDVNLCIEMNLRLRDAGEAGAKPEDN